MRTSRIPQASAWTTTLMAALLCSGAASAEPGDHIGGEDVQLIPAVELGAFHRTNAYLQEGDASGGVPVSGGTALFVAPSLGIRAKNSDLVFGFDVLYQARKYLQSDLSNLDRFNNFNLGGRLELFPDGKVGFKLADRFSISGREVEDDAGFSNSAYQQHLLNDLTAFVAIHPGGPLEVDVGGKLQVDKWNVPEEFKSDAEDREYDLDLASSLTGPGLNSRIGYGPELKGQWRFFPKTAVAADFTYQWFNWSDNIVDAQGDNASGDEVGDFLGVPDGSLWRARAGLRGRVTPKLVIGVLAGFGQSLYNEDSVTEQAAELGLGGSDEFADSVGVDTDLKSFPDGLLAEVEGRYEFVEDQSFMVSYRRDFQDVFFTNFVSYDRVQGGYQGLFAERLGVDITGSYRYERYQGEVTRDDHMIQAGLGASYLVKQYLSVNLGTDWRRRASADGNHPEIEFDDVGVQGGVKFTY